MKNVTFNRSQLKIIAIISMLIDHFAWGFLDFYTPLAQFLHVLGRFCIPIMCFFVAEGFRKTKNLTGYIQRMATFAVVTIIPFYMFFHEEYDYRQNIIFDYLLGLLLLAVLENKKFVKWQKVVLSVLLFAVSATIGGWVIEPMLYILIFYYFDDHKKRVKWFCIATVGMEIFLMVSISLNSIYHFSHYDWVWWDKLYLLGFMLALPLIGRYNGEKGPKVGGKYFFYMFYPSHFIVYCFIKFIISDATTVEQMYQLIHVITLICGVVLVGMTFRARPSEGRSAITAFVVASSVYVLGFLLETMSSTPEAYYIDCIVEYIGEFLAIISALVFVSYMCRIHIPNYIMALHGVAAIALLYSLARTRSTGFFYSYIGVNNEGPFPRLELVHSTGFYLSMIYMGIVCLEIIGMCISVLLHGSKLDKKRVRFIIYSTFGAWIPYLMTVAGLTGGYEIPALGLLFVVVLLYLTFIRFGTLDSVSLASENALDHGREGVIVLDSANCIQYHNSIVDKVLGDFPHNKNVLEWPLMREVMEGKRTDIEVDGRIYDFKVEPLFEHGYEQGKMIWLIDSTDHYYAMMEIAEYANKDGLTGLYNRNRFKELVNEEVDAGKKGTFLMMDVDNFKQVNDAYGHQRGDTVLMSLANILVQFPENIMYACRIGGDEFCAYLRGNTDRREVEAIMRDIMDKFANCFRPDDDVKCSISMGAVINDGADGRLMSCSEMYSSADDKLYKAKDKGKDTFVM